MLGGGGAVLRPNTDPTKVGGAIGAATLIAPAIVVGIMSGKGVIEAMCDFYQ